MNALLPVLVFLPVTVGALLTLVRSGRVRALVTLATVIASTGVAAAVTVAVIRSGDETVALNLAGWSVPLGIQLRADVLSVAMLGLTSVVALAVTLYATGSEKVRGSDAFWPLWLLLLGGLQGLWISGDLFNLYVMMELITVAAVSLVALGGRGAAGAALRYLFIAVVGSLLFLLAVAIIYAQAGTLDINLAGERMADSALLPVVLGLCAVGLGAKIALVPLHSWLPVAHPAAPAAVSAVLSALVIKAALLVLWRMWFSFAPGTAAAVEIGTVVSIVGAVAVLWGAIMALRSDGLKLIIAYSTVSQVGYLVIVLALGSRPDGVIDDAVRTGWTGAIVMALAHGLAKAAMFLAAGTLATAYGTDKLANLKGAVTTMPMTVATIAIAGVSLAGLPPTFGFVPKWLLLQSTAASDEWWLFIPLLAGGLLAFGYTSKIIRATFSKPGDTDIPRPQLPKARVLTIVPFALAVLLLILGFASAPLIELIETGYPSGGEL